MKDPGRRPDGAWPPDRQIGWLSPVLALVWGALTLFAAWPWVMGRWRIVLMPILTIVALGAAATIAP